MLKFFLFSTDNFEEENKTAKHYLKRPKHHWKIFFTQPSFSNAINLILLSVTPLPRLLQGQPSPALAVQVAAVALVARLLPVQATLSPATAATIASAM